LPYYGNQRHIAKEDFSKLIDVNSGPLREFSVHYFADVTYEVFTNYVNIFLDGHFFDDFTPYIGGGVGISIVNVELIRPTVLRIPFYNTNIIDGNFNNSDFNGEDYTRTKVKSTNLAWHLTFGVVYSLYKNIDIDFSYRFQNIGFKEKIGVINLDEYGNYPIIGQTEVDLTKSDQVQMALRFSF
jgi:opacity protein-like surface antigen